MAKLFGSNGVLMGWLHSVEEEAMHPIPNDMTIIEFDEDTNPQVVSNLHNHWNEHDLVGGILRRQGVVVVFNPDGAGEIERKLIRADPLNITPMQVESVLTDIAARRTQITTERTVIASDITALASATTLAQIRPIVNRMLAREDNALNAENRILLVLVRLIRGIRRLV